MGRSVRELSYENDQGQLITESRLGRGDVTFELLRYKYVAIGFDEAILGHVIEEKLNEVRLANY